MAIFLSLSIASFFFAAFSQEPLFLSAFPSDSPISSTLTNSLRSPFHLFRDYCTFLCWKCCLDSTAHLFSSLSLHCAKRISLRVAISASVASRSSSKYCAFAFFFCFLVLLLMSSIQSSSSSSMRLVLSSVSLSHDTLVSWSCPMLVLFSFSDAVAGAISLLS